MLLHIASMLNRLVIRQYCRQTKQAERPDKIGRETADGIICTFRLVYSFFSNLRCHFDSSPPLGFAVVFSADVSLFLSCFSIHASTPEVFVIGVSAQGAADAGAGSRVGGGNSGGAARVVLPLLAVRIDGSYGGGGGHIGWLGGSRFLG